MTGYAYRFSIIPGGAVTDARLTPRALQVLCLLGRHTNDAGWCARSQVKMAKEIGCSRSTIYDALELLLEAGWIEKQHNGRGGRDADSASHPFAACSFRVRLDRNDLPQHIKDGDEFASEPEGGAAPERQGVPVPPAGGAAPEPAPLEGLPSEGISSEPERETRARARKQAEGLANFEARWPTAAADDRHKTAYAWEALTDTEREAALAGIGPFLANLKQHKRSGIPAGWKYLEQKRWMLIERKDEPPKIERFEAVENSEQWNAWTVFYGCIGAVSGIPGYLISTIGGQRVARLPSEWPPVGSGLSLDRATWTDVVAGSGQFAAWLRRLREGPPVNIALPTKMIDGKPVGYLRVPCEWPPRKDGSTGPPSSDQNVA